MNALPNGAATTPAGFDVDRIRRDFPILSTEIYGKPLVYLDNAASAQKPRPVLDAMDEALSETYANVHRGLHYLSNQSTEKYEAARDKVARFLNAGHREEIVFTSGGTEAINLVASTLGAAGPASGFAGGGIGEGDEIILSVMEHHSNIVPWHFLRERKGAVIKWLMIDEAGQIDPTAFEALIGPRTKLAALTHMSNVLGVATPAKELIEIAHRHGVMVLLDGCQSAVHQPIDVRDLDCDFYVFTGHKLYGPTGIGALFGKRDLLNALPPYKGGGEMIDVVAFDRVTYADAPERFEAGTPPIAEAIGLGAAIDYLDRIDRRAALDHEHALGLYAREKLRALNWVRLYGDPESGSAIVPFGLEAAHPHDVGQILDRSGVAIRAGHHCAQPLMAHLGVTATARASFAMYNDREDVDSLVEALIRARRILE